jgi:hypothetical protein
MQSTNTSVTAVRFPFILHQYRIYSLTVLDLSPKPTFPTNATIFPESHPPPSNVRSSSNLRSQ